MPELRRPFRLGAVVLASLVLVCAGASFAAANVVPKSGAGQLYQSISALDELVPAACASLNVVNFITGSGTLTGSNQRDYIVGSSGADTITGKNQSDCILGSAGDDDIDAGSSADVVYGSDGNDIINGGAGADLLYGGSGNDEIHASGGGDIIDGGPGVDACYGQGGTDTFLNCETVVQ